MSDRDAFLAYVAAESAAPIVVPPPAFVLVRKPRLTEADVVAIRNVYATEIVSHKELGRRYGVAAVTVGKILTGRRHKSAGGPVYPQGSGHDYRRRREAALSPEPIA